MKNPLSKVSELISSFENRKDEQIFTVPQFFNLFRKLPGKKDRKSVEFFFYSDTIENAEELKNDLVKITGYEVYGVDKSFGKISVIGCTPEMDLSERNFEEWVEKMNELALHSHSSEFDGWGMLCD